MIVAARHGYRRLNPITAASDVAAPPAAPVTMTPARDDADTMLPADMKDIIMTSLFDADTARQRALMSVERYADAEICCLIDLPG